MELDFTEEQQIRYLSGKGYTITERTEIQHYQNEELLIVIREANKDGRTLSLYLAFLNEVKKSILER